MNYLEVIPVELKRHMDKFNTVIITNKRAVREAMEQRGMEDCDSIMVRKRNQRGQVTRILVYVGSPENVLHEVGHILDMYKGSDTYWSGSDTFQEIYKKESPLATEYVDYLRSNSKEYFAESVLDYLLDKQMLKEARPKTHDWIEVVLATIRLYEDV